MLVCGCRARKLQIQWYQGPNLTIMEEWVAGEDVLDLGSRAGSVLNYKYRVNLDRR